MGMLEAVEKVFLRPNITVYSPHLYSKVFFVMTCFKVKLVAKMLTVIHAQERKKAVWEKTKAMVEEMRAMKPKGVAGEVGEGTDETLTYCDFFQRTLDPHPYQQCH